MLLLPAVGWHLRHGHFACRKCERLQGGIWFRCVDGRNIKLLPQHGIENRDTLGFAHDSAGDQLGKEHLHVHDFHAPNRLAGQRPEILLVAGEQKIRAPGDRPSEYRLVFLCKLHSSDVGVRRQLWTECAFFNAPIAGR
jgi:hypothetical protein